MSNPNFLKYHDVSWAFKWHFKCIFSLGILGDSNEHLWHLRGRFKSSRPASGVGVVTFPSSSKLRMTSANKINPINWGGCLKSILSFGGSPPSYLNLLVQIRPGESQFWKTFKCDLGLECRLTSPYNSPSHFTFRIWYPATCWSVCV